MAQVSREIPLTQGYVTVVDDSDFEALSRYRWKVLKVKGKVYASRTSGNATVLMHKALTGYERTDHIDGDGLNNRRSNLRPATQRQNVHNSRPRAGTSSRFVGVRLQRRTGRWEAYIKTDGKYKQLGTFETEEAAARARDAAAYERDPEFAYLNFRWEWQ